MHLSTLHNIKEWIGAIYSLQSYNHGFCGARELQGCNLLFGEFSGLYLYRLQETVKQKCLYMKYFEPHC